MNQSVAPSPPNLQSNLHSCLLSEVQVLVILYAHLLEALIVSHILVCTELNRRLCRCQVKKSHSLERQHLAISECLGISDYMMSSKKSGSKSRMCLHTCTPPFVRAKLKMIFPSQKFLARSEKWNVFVLGLCVPEYEMPKRRPSKKGVGCASWDKAMYPKGNLCWLALKDTENGLPVTSLQLSHSQSLFIGFHSFVSIVLPL